MVKLASPAAQIGAACPDFTLMSTEDEMVTRDDFTDAKVLVVVFMCNHCPFVQAILARLNAFADEYYDKGVVVVGINSNDAAQYPDDSFINMKKLPLAFDYLWDKTQSVATEFGAVCTPDYFVYDAERKLQYRGRFDDSDALNPDAIPEQFDLQFAVDALLCGEQVATEQVPSEGCSIKWRTEPI